jgi:hypothetical protein
MSVCIITKYGNSLILAGLPPTIFRFKFWQTLGEKLTITKSEVQIKTRLKRSILRKDWITVMKNVSGCTTMYCSSFHIWVIPCQTSKNKTKMSKLIFFVDFTPYSKKKPHITFFSKTPPFWSRPFWTLRLFFGQKKFKFTKWPPKC